MPFDPLNPGPGILRGLKGLIPQQPPPESLPPAPRKLPQSPPIPYDLQHIVNTPPDTEMPSGIPGGIPGFGRMEVSGEPPGTKLDNRNVGALAGLRAANKADEQPYRSNEELYRQSFDEPGHMAPGAQEMAQNMLKQRIGDEAFSDENQRADLKMIGESVAQGHPAVQGALGAEAARKAIPATITAQNQLQGQQIAGQSRIGAAQITAGGANRNSMRQSAAMLEQGLARMPAAARLTPEGQAEIARTRANINYLLGLASALETEGP